MVRQAIEPDVEEAIRAAAALAWPEDDAEDLIIFEPASYNRARKPLRL